VGVTVGASVGLGVTDGSGFGVAVEAGAWSAGVFVVAALGVRVALAEHAEARRAVNKSIKMDFFIFSPKSISIRECIIAQETLKMMKKL
jgi:hypothetical protein